MRGCSGTRTAYRTCRPETRLPSSYLQGVNVARDRAWQLELERRRYLGTSAAFLGPEAAGWDVFARQARLADTARRCFEALDDETREWITAYVDGVNHALPGGARRAPGVRRDRADAAGVGAVDAARDLAGDARPVRRVPDEAVADARRPAPRRRSARAVQLGGAAHVREQRLADPRLAHHLRPGDRRRRPAPLHREPGRLPADPADLPGVRRPRPGRPRHPGPRPLRPHRQGRLGDHQRDGRLPGPVRRTTPPHRIRRRGPRPGRLDSLRTCTPRWSRSPGRTRSRSR